MSTDGGELEVRIQDMEVRMMRMEKVQYEILGRVQALEAYLNPPMYKHGPARGSSSLIQYSNPSPFTHMPTQTQIGAHGSYQPYAPIVQAQVQLQQQPNVQEQPNLQQQQPDIQIQLNSSELSAPDSLVGNVSILPSPVQVRLRTHATPALPSSEIPKQTLRTVREVLDENAKLQTESCAGTLCQKLAKECFFGKDIMKRCTPGGNRQFPALPQDELNELKKVLFHLFPRFHTCPGSFEAVWKKCITAIEQACKRLCS